MHASWQARVAAFWVRRRVKPVLGDMRDLNRVRKRFGTLLPVPRGIRVTPATVAGVPGEWVEAAAGPAPTITLLYLHGGGFVGCSPATHRSLTAALALHGLRVFVPDYRLAPEHPFPAALDDALAVWRELARLQPPGQRLVVAGDSAGGNLALAAMLMLRDARERLPDAAALFSPAVDLTGGSASLTGNSDRDAMFHGPSLERLSEAYLAGADAGDPRVSPLLGRLDGLPPLLLHVGDDEVLRDDSLRLAAKARDAGVPVQLQTFAAVPHVWQLLGWLPEARRSVRAAADFLRAAALERYVEHHDVIIVGAGLSGIGAAAHLRERCPERSFTILEARQAIGGTWDLFRYPGVRSDSDMFTLGYEFKPWAGAQAIADGPSIRRYIEQTATERGLTPQVRFGHRVVAAEWCSQAARWTVHVERGPDRVPLKLTCSFLYACPGYYSYAQGYRPPFPGEARFKGRMVHPQFWPEQLAYEGRRVLVIGSGATAVTLVPEMAKAAAQVTMLQRSPSYVVARPSHDTIAEKLQRWLPQRLAYSLVRAKNVAISIYYFKLARRFPAQTKARLLGFVRQHLGRDYDVAKHFTPRYDVWDQRVCLVPDADLFKAIRGGKVEVVTDEIETFVESGVRLRSGREIAADIVVTATGLQLNVLGDITLTVDGTRCDLSQALAYKGAMYSDVPNLACTFGYTNASWTLKADLTARWVCRLLNHMRRHRWAVAVPRRDAGVMPEPFLDFTSGYVQRAVDKLPKQGSRKPWRLYQNYLLDLLTLRYGRLDDGTLQFSPPRPAGTPATTASAGAASDPALTG